MVILTAQRVVAAQPGMSPLDDPALLLHRKATLALQSLHNLQLAHAAGCQPWPNTPREVWSAHTFFKLMLRALFIANLCSAPTPSYSCAE